MNPATKTKISNLITAAVAVIAVMQTSLTTPPFTPASIKIVGGVLAFLSILLTYCKQQLSADVSNVGSNITLLLIGLPAVLAGLADMLDLFTFSDAAAHWITWLISVLLMVVNVCSKLFFPSTFQKEKIDELKTIDPSKTQ